MKMEEPKKNHNKNVRIDGTQAIYDYTHCKKIRECKDCECFKTVDFDRFNTLCDFLRTYTAKARDEIEKALDAVL